MRSKHIPNFSYVGNHWGRTLPAVLPLALNNPQLWAFLTMFSHCETCQAYTRALSLDWNYFSIACDMGLIKPRLQPAGSIWSNSHQASQHCTALPTIQSRYSCNVHCCIAMKHLPWCSSCEAGPLNLRQVALPRAASRHSYSLLSMADLQIQRKQHMHGFRPH